MYLNCHSFHSLRYGTIPVADLVGLGKTCGAPAMALTDINTVTGIYEFYKKCNEAGIKPIVGMEMREGNKLLYIQASGSAASDSASARSSLSPRLYNIRCNSLTPTDVKGYFSIIPTLRGKGNVAMSFGSL